ncbi:MAG: response regulator [Verrucomicrobiota bacterium]
MKALIIEDDPVSIMTLEMMLRKLQITSKTARGVVDAISILLTYKPEIIFLDLFLGSNDGLEFLQTRMGNLRLKQIPVVIVSSSSQFDAINVCLKNGADAYLIKPVQFNLLVDVLRKLGIPVANQ